MRSTRDILGETLEKVEREKQQEEEGNLQLPLQS